MPELASTRFGVDVEPVVASRSFCRRLVFARLNFVGNVAAGAVAKSDGTGAPAALPGSRIVIRELASGKEDWQIAAADVTGGTSPGQLLDDIQSDLDAMSVEHFGAKWGITI